MIRFTVEGEPVAKARPRVVKGRAYTPQRTVDAEEAVGWAFREEMPGTLAPLTGWVGMRCTFYTMSNHPRSDVDNLLKLVSDALEGLAYVNDKQVEDVHAKRVRGDAAPRTVIEIWPIVEPAGGK